MWDGKFPTSELVDDPIFVRGEFVTNVERLTKVIVLETNKNHFVNGNEKLPVSNANQPT